MKKIILESPVFTIEAAIEAANMGIDRLELCADFGEGGVTPSAGALKYLKNKISIPIFVMIRPRGGDFIYSDEELQVMKEDIRILKALGADGFVFGALTAEGYLDKIACEELILSAEGLPCTLHRAFDETQNLEKSLEDAIHCGYKRILTSGGMNTVSDGLSMIIKLIKIAKSKLIIMPGGGLDPSHLPLLHASSYLKEVHASCKAYRPSLGIYKNPYLKISHDTKNSDKVLTINRNTVKSFQNNIQNLEIK